MVDDKAWQPVCPPVGKACSDEEYARAVAEPATPVFIQRNGWGSSRQMPAHPEDYLQAHFSKAYLEFNQRGEPHDPNQNIAIQRHLAAAREKARPLFVVVYVHGWHHNADTSTDDPKANVNKFDDLLARFWDSLGRRFPQGGQPDVLGIYVGWAGERTTAALGTVLSIKDRAHAADQIGRAKGDGALAPSLQGIAEQVRGISPDSRMIVIGHSLGGRMLTRAFVPDVAAGHWQPLGERVLINTINAAVGAEAYSALYNQDQVAQQAGIPGWVNITAEDDDATGKVYPLALDAGLLHPDPEGDPAAMHRTIGHYRPYITHVLEIQQCNANDPTAKNTCGASQAVEDESDTQLWQVGEFRKLSLRYPLRLDSGMARRRDNETYCGIFVRQPMLIGAKDEVKKKDICPAERWDFDFASLSDKDHVFPLAAHRVPARGRMWNIGTSQSLLDFAQHSRREFSTHNGYVSTNWVRLLVQLIYEPELGQGARQ